MSLKHHAIIEADAIVVAVKRVVLQPWSESWPIEVREPEARCGKRCASHAAGGSSGRRFKSAMCVDWSTMEPSGGRTARCRVVIFVCCGRVLRC